MVTSAVLPTLLTPLAAAVLVWLPGWALRGTRNAGQRSRRVERAQTLITLTASALTLAVSVQLAADVHAQTVTSHDVRAAISGGLLGLDLFIDALSSYVILLVNIVALAAAWFLSPWWSTHGRRGTSRDASRRALFHSLFHLFHATMLLVPAVANLVALWIGIELTTVTSTALVALGRSRASLEAAWKYIVITSTGIVFALLATVFLAASQNTGTPTLDWPSLVGAHDARRLLVVLAFLFAMVGYGTKAGLAPMHTWLPDAHGEAPYPVSALLSGVLLKSALYAILRFKMITDHALQDGGRLTNRILLTAGLLSIAWAVPSIVRRNRIKRVLAYHSLEHMGIITLGLGVGGTFATFGALLHMLNHGVTKCLMFLAYGTVQDHYVGNGSDPPTTGSDPTQADAGRAEPDLVEIAPRGVLAALPWTGRMLALGGLALIGAPPFSIFLSELLILWGAMDHVLNRAGTDRAGWITVIAVLASSMVLIFAGLVRHLVPVLLGTPPDDVRRERARVVLPLAALLVLALGLGLIVIDADWLPLRSLVLDGTQVICGGAPCR